MKGVWGMKRFFLIMVVSVLSLSFLFYAIAEVPVSEAKETAADSSDSFGSSSAAASSSGEVLVVEHSHDPIFGGKSGTTIEVVNSADAAASSEGSGESSASASSSTTVVVKTEDDSLPFGPLPVPPYTPPHHHSGGSSSSSSSKAVETIVKSTPVEGTGNTLKSKVNVRAMASIYSARVAVIRNSGTIMEITEEVINSSGEIWYAVKLYNGTMGYVLGSLVYADIVPLAKESEPEKVVVKYVYITPEPEVTPEVIYITKDYDMDPTPTPIYVYVTPAPDGEGMIGNEDDIING